MNDRYYKCHIQDIESNQKGILSTPFLHQNSSSIKSLFICQSYCLSICISFSNIPFSIQPLVTNDKHNGFIEKQKERDGYFLRRRTMGTLLHSPSPFHPQRSTKESIVGIQCNTGKLLRRHITFN